jgi:uncharacterized protein YutE (UPF0331/DUF86 family)
LAERDVVLAKVATIDRCLARITEVSGARRAALQPLDVEDITVVNLQRSIQAAIDLASHVCATERYGVPKDLAETFSLLERHGLLSAELTLRLRKMVGFRNIAVHDYEALDPAILRAIVERHLDDLRAFARALLDLYVTD